MPKAKVRPTANGTHDAAPPLPPTPPAEALAPESQPNEPGPRCTVVFTRPAGVTVNEDTALTLGAVFGCVRAISEDLAKLPFNVFEKRAGGGRERRDDDVIDWLLHVQANPETPAFQFRETLVAHALTWGNGYAEIERDVAGRPTWLWQLTPDRVTPFRAEGQIYYEVWNPGRESTYLPAEDVLHLRGLGFDGLVGYSVIRMAAREIGLGIATAESGSTFFGNDSTPGGILKHKGRLSPEARRNLFESWQRQHGGPTNRRKVAILEEDMSWEATGLPPEEARLVEVMEATPAMISRWFRIPPHKIADLTRATFSNIESQSTEYVGDSLLPWATRLEQECNVKLFGRTNRGRKFTKHNFSALLRGDTAARSAFYNSMLDRGVFSINDVREKEDMNPLGADGDKRFVPLNMQLLENAGEEVQPPVEPPRVPQGETSPAEGDNAPPKEEESRMARLEAVCMPLLEQACERVLKREADRAKKPADPADRRDYAAKALLGPVRVLAELYCARSDAAADVGLGQFLERHLAGGRGEPKAMAGQLREYVRAAAGCVNLKGE